MINKTVKHIRHGTLANAVYKKATGIIKRRKIRRIIIGYHRDLYNITRYGWAAPRFSERIWIDPRNCNMFIPGDIIRESCGMSTRAASGMVIRSSWPFEQALHVNKQTKFKFCIDHWVNGIPWEYTGVYEYFEKKFEQINIEQKSKKLDGCKNMDDVIQRYQKLDLIFEQIKSERRMESRDKIAKNNFREMGGVAVHVGIDGEPFFGGGGWHRFAIAYILQIPLPVMICCVHVSAIPYLKEYRKG